MTASDSALPGLVRTTRRLARSALAAGENRLELVIVELEEERERVFGAFSLLLGVAALALLAGVALTAVVVVYFWPDSRVIPAAFLTLLYAGGGLALYRRLQRRLREWQILPETLRQLRRDRAALSARLQ